jgi:hypothetical protein
LDDYFAGFESIVSNLRACGPHAYTDNECAKQLLYALDDHVWDMKITALEESTDFAALDIEKLFIKIKSHEFSCKGHPNHDASSTSKALITSTQVAMMLTPPTPSHLLWSMLCLLLLQLSMINMRAFLTTTLPCLQGNFGICFSFRRRGDGTLETPRVVLSAATPPTTPRGRCTKTRTTTRKRIASDTRRRRTSRRSCPKHVQP